MKFKTIIMLGAAISLAACSSTPEPAPENTSATNTSTIVPTPQPVNPNPEPTGPTTVENVPTGPVFEAPLPGSVEDFLYASGGEGRVFFAYNQYDLSSESIDVLRRQAQWLQNYPSVTAVIEGNADERGTREYNLALAARRAESVKSFLVSQGVSPNRLTTVSYGKERPIDPRSSEAGWARNRNANTNLMSGSIG